jgi:hypothetical protein
MMPALLAVCRALLHITGAQAARRGDRTDALFMPLQPVPTDATGEKR